jgi:hypothetical protein
MQRTQQRLQGLVSGKSIPEIEHTNTVPDVIIHYYFSVFEDNSEAIDILGSRYPGYSEIIKHRLGLMTGVFDPVAVEQKVCEHFNRTFVDNPELIHNSYQHIQLMKPKRGRPKISDQKRAEQKLKHKEEVKANMKRIYSINKLATDLEFTKEELLELDKLFTKTNNEKFKNLSAFFSKSKT